MHKADKVPPSCAVITKSGSLNFLETSGPVQACNRTDLPLPYYNIDITGTETAIIMRETIPLHRIEKLPSARGMSGIITTHCPVTHTPLLAITRNKKQGSIFQH